MGRDRHAVTVLFYESGVGPVLAQLFEAVSIVVLGFVLS
jgi:hypothetical protein